MFILNESGSKTKSEAVVKAKANSVAALRQPKDLIFDKRFIVLLKHTDKEKYLFCNENNKHRIIDQIFALIKKKSKFVGSKD